LKRCNSVTDNQLKRDISSVTKGKQSEGKIVTHSHINTSVQFCSLINHFEHPLCNAKYLVSLKYELIQIRLVCIIDTDTRYLTENVSRYKIQDTFFVFKIRI